MEGSAMSDAKDSRAGSMFGPYHLKRVLGQGGMGAVYEAEHTVKGWTVAAKLMSEAIETADRGPVEGVIAAGGGRLAVMRFGLLPQVLPVFASQALYFFESNTRSATIIGIVGAGGIGLFLSEMIRVLEWQEAAFLIVMVLITVAVIDVISRRLRAAIMGAPRAQ